MIAPWLIVVLIVGLCLLAEGFFSGSELALVSCDRVRLHQRAVAGDRGAMAAEALLKNPTVLFSTTLLGTNLSTITASTVTTLYLIKHYGAAYGSFALLLAPIILIFAEIIPKSVFQQRADVLVDRVAPILHLFRKVFYPAVWLVMRLTEPLLGGVREASAQGMPVTREELSTMLVAEEAQHGDMKAVERTMVTQILGMAEQRVRNVMVPLIELEILPQSATREAAVSVFELKGCPHIPVFAQRTHNVVGVLEATDVLCADKDTALQQLIRQPCFVPEEMRLNELFRMLRESKEEAAVVVDEYGGAVGLVTMEDIVEEFVGEIRDEFELDEQMYRRVGVSHYVINARLEVEIAEEELGLELPETDCETLGGILLERFGYIPKVGESTDIEGMRYVVKEASARAIQLIEVTRAPEEFTT